MSNSWYEVLSVLHLMAMLSLSQANTLLLPKKTADSYQSKVSEESRRASIDIFLKAAGYLDFAVQLVLPQFPPELSLQSPVSSLSKRSTLKQSVYQRGRRAFYLSLSACRSSLLFPSSES
ncbi:hypothetical protein L1049_016498 [Liquidambar formosana]|uniref:Uncharacterized protein n=1 Tax=Liquidambar formosana TaxID=63359 RepID=A0AAP0X3I0_LIQFO